MWASPAPAWVVNGRSFAGLGKGGATAIVLVGRDQSSTGRQAPQLWRACAPAAMGRPCNKKDWHRRRCDASPVLPRGHAADGAVAGRAEGSSWAGGPDSHSASLMPKMR